MVIKGLMIDPATNHPIVLLRDEAGELLLPIWIGVFEASAIQLHLEGVEPKRPMTHDLFRSTLESLGTRIDRIVIRDLIEHTFVAAIHLDRQGDRLEVDSRPSDAIALAIRCDAPIFVQPVVLEKANAIHLSAAGAEDEDRLKKWFEELGPEDLGKYTM